MGRRRDIYRGHPRFGWGDIDTSKITIRSYWDTLTDDELAKGERAIASVWMPFMKGMGGVEEAAFHLKTGSRNLAALLQSDSLLEEAREELSQGDGYREGVMDVRRATLEDAQGDATTGWDRVGDALPTRTADVYSDIVVELEEPLDLGAMEVAATAYGYDVQRSTVEGVEAYGQPEEVYQLDASAMDGHHGSVLFTPEPVYRLGGHPKQGERGEAEVRERLKLLDEYLDRI